MACYNFDKLRGRRSIGRYADRPNSESTSQRHHLDDDGLKLPWIYGFGNSCESVESKIMDLLYQDIIRMWRDYHS